MHQRGDLNFVGILNKIQTGEVDQDVEKFLRSRFISNNNQTIPAEDLHIYAENAPVDIHTQSMLTTLVTPFITIKAIDKLPDKFFLSENQLQNTQNMEQNETCNLPCALNLKIGAGVMITSKINIDDRLVNGMVRQVAHFFISYGRVKTVYLKFDDVNIGRSTMQSDIVGREN